MTTFIGALQGLTNKEPWTENAICAQADPEVWFPEQGRTAAEARRICANCPVAVECLEYALKHNIGHGVWGGFSERERNTMKREPQRLPGFCRNDHNLLEVGMDANGACRQCRRDRWDRYRDRRRLGLVPPKRRVS